MTATIRKTSGFPGFLFLFVLVFGGAWAAQAPAAQGAGEGQDLLLRHREWLKITDTFILPAEKEAFLSLTNERDRDMFMEAFWKQRDPRPDTPRNEFREEIEKRFRFVMENFGRLALREAWQTDQGRIYMILGPPQSKDTYEGTSGLHPAVIWHYIGDPIKKLPQAFDLVFFQRGGGGEFRLYDPISDGPASLLVDTRQFNRNNPIEVFQKIKDIAPPLARAALTIVPNQMPSNYRPTPQNTMIIADIFASAKRGISTAYVNHFLNYRGIVGPEYLANFIESDASASLVRDGGRGMTFLHFAILPRHSSFDYDPSSDQYGCDFKLTVGLKSGETTVFQYVRDYPFRFPAGQVENVRKNGIAVQDIVPVAQGKFKLTVLLQNAVGKEFSLFEKSLDVPAETGPAELTEPFIGYGLQEAPEPDYAPYKLAGRRILTDPRATINRADTLVYGLSVLRLPPDLWAGGTVDVAAAGTMSGGKPVTLRTIKLSETEYSPTLTITGETPAVDLRPDYYELTFSLKNAAGRVLAATEANFILSPVAEVPRAVILHSTVPESRAFLFDYGLAVQYDQSGDAARAEEAYRKIQRDHPEFEEGMFRFANFLVRAGNNTEALEIVELFAASSNFRFDYFLIKGLALEEKGAWEAALANLLEARKLYGGDTRVLNALGGCYYRTGKKAEAREALNASLRLASGQAEVRALLERIEKERPEDPPTAFD